MTECQHCGQPVILVAGRWVHVTRFSRHGWQHRPAFVTCPTSHTTIAAPAPRRAVA